MGLGTELVVALLRCAAGEGMGLVLVLGDPAYYGRHGFRVEEAISAPYPLAPEWRGAWQCINLAGAGGKEIAAPCGRLLVPAPWQRAELWAA